jgi:hypothetical protein
MQISTLKVEIARLTQELSIGNTRATRLVMQHQEWYGVYTLCSVVTKPVSNAHVLADINKFPFPTADLYCMFMSQA